MSTGWVEAAVLASLAAGSTYRPGSIARAGARLARSACAWLAVGLAAIAPVLADDRVRFALFAESEGAARAAARWFVGPSAPRDLVVMGGLLALVGVDRARAAAHLARRLPRWRRPTTADALFAASLVIVTLGAAALRVPYLHLGLAPDGESYAWAAARLPARVAESGWNPVAFGWVYAHPSGREPLFPLLVRGAFNVFGERADVLIYLTFAASLLAVVWTAIYGRVVLGPVEGVIAAALLAALQWHALASGQGLREDAVLVMLLPLACVTSLDVESEYVVPLLAGVLGAGAALTRLESAGLVLALFGLWLLRARHRWRVVLAAATFGVLMLPMLAGNWALHGSALAQLGSGMGSDIRAVTDPLMRLELPLPDVLRYLGTGAWQMYGPDLLLDIGDTFPRPVEEVVGRAALCSFLVGFGYHAWRGKRELCLLAVLGCIVPPFAFIAGTSALGIGGGYVPRYTYLILVPVLALAAWLPARLVVAGGRAGGRLIRWTALRRA